MSWRTVLISRRAKLEFQLGYMVVRGDEIRKVFLDEISILIIEHTGVSLTAGLLAELSRRKVKVIFCDEQRNPHSELVSYYGSHDTSLKYKEQMKWKAYTKELIWTEIVKEKIRHQMEHLKSLSLIHAETLKGYLEEVEHNDESNREGHAARIYFLGLFGEGFSRAHDNPTNAALNYGYSILLSAFNREIVSSGYFTQLGLFHDNRFNPFNLASDLMEPFRPLVDQRVVQLKPTKLEHDEKMEMVNVLNQKIWIKGKEQYVSNAIGVYCRSVFQALTEDEISGLCFFEADF